MKHKATYAEYDYLNGEFTGKYYTEEEAQAYENTYYEGKIHLGLEPIE